MHRTTGRAFNRFLRSNSFLIFLLAASPFLVYFDVVFLNYTMSFNEVSIHSGIHFGNLLPVADPAAGSLQDHPWLFKIGKSLRQGFIPLINLDNGLGAALLESLQSGVLYPLNILLVFIDLSSPYFFDIFSVLHVLILSFNSFLLFKLYVRWEVAAILASAFALSPLTFAQINMVYYRAFVWTLLIVWSSVCLARGKQSIYIILIAVGAIICSITAGNPQESFFGLVAAIAFFMAESFRSSRASRKTFLIFALTIAAGLLISSPSVLPFLMSRSAGLLDSVEDDLSRSSTLISMKWLSCWFIPYINGSYPKFYRVSALRGEFPTFSLHPLFMFLTIAGFWTLFINKENHLRSKKIFISLFVFGILGIISTCEASPFQQIIQHLPFIKTIRITKYTSYINGFMSKSFNLISPGTHVQLTKDSIITETQVNLLRLMGVTSIYGYSVKDDEIAQSGESFATIKGTLPQIFLIQSTASLETYCQAGNYSKALKSIQSLMLAQAVDGIRKVTNKLAFTLDGSGQGTLVSLQAFTPGWKFEGKSASKFCGIFNSWEGTFEAGRPYIVNYEPPGLKRSYVFVCLGVLLLFFAIKVCDRSAPESLTAGSANQ